MADEIYVDPSVTDASVIRIGGACYYRVGPSSNPPDTFDVDDTFSDCGECSSSSSSRSSSSSSSGCILDDCEHETIDPYHPARIRPTSRCFLTVEAKIVPGC